MDESTLKIIKTMSEYTEENDKPNSFPIPKGSNFGALARGILLLINQVDELKAKVAALEKRTTFS